MQFQIVSTYSQKDIANVLHGAHYLMWTSKPVLRFLWNIRIAFAVFFSVVGVVLCGYSLLNNLKQLLSWILGICCFAVAFIIGGRPNRNSKMVKWIWKNSDKRGFIQQYCFDEEKMSFINGDDWEEYSYDSIVTVLEDKKNYFLCVEEKQIQCVLVKKDFKQGEPEEFRKFIAEKTGKPVVYFK